MVCQMGKRKLVGVENKKIRRGIRLAFIVLGSFLLLGMLGLLGYYGYKGYATRRDIQKYLLAVKYVISEESETGRNVDLAEPFAKEENESNDPIMKVVEIDGYPYVGYLRIPDLQMELPILDQCSSELLELSPCRYSGSNITNDFVIQGYNYRSHFKLLKKIEVGTDVIFTDMEGFDTTYHVVELEGVEETSLEQMPVGEWDLSLFVCADGGETKAAVRCMIDK